MKACIYPNASVSLLFEHRENNVLALTVKNRETGAEIDLFHCYHLTPSGEEKRPPLNYADEMRLVALRDMLLAQLKFIEHMAG